MNTTKSTSQTPAVKVDSGKRLVSGQRVLQVNVPQRLFELAKAKALMEGKAWGDFVIGLLKSATADLVDRAVEPSGSTRE